MSETTILVSEQIGLLFAEQFTGPDTANQLYPYIIGPGPLSEDYYDEGAGD